MRRSMHVVTAGALALPLLLATIGSAGAAPAAPVAPAGGEPPAYRVAAVLDDGNNTPVGRGLNETGTVVGHTDYPDTKAFVWDQASGLTKLPGLPGDIRRFAFDVNDGGTVVGHSGYEGIEFPQLAVRWVGGVPESLGVLPGGTDSHAEAINEAGTIVGSSNSSGGNHAFVWTEEGGMIDITPSSPPTQIAHAFDVNESDQVTGYMGSRAFVWEDGVLTNLGAPTGFAFSFAFAINDAGVVAAHVTTASGDVERVARWTPGVGWQVLGGVGSLNVAWGINNDGTIVGEGRPSAGLERAFVYLEGIGLLSLTELLTTDDWFLLSAADVDDAGRIIAQASNRQTGEGATLLLEPVTGTSMHDEGLRVLLRGTPDPSSGLAKLRVVDEAGDPVRRALVDGAWSRNGEVVAESDTDETDRAGRAELRHAFAGLASGDVLRFCVTTITHAAYEYDPPSGGPSCARARVP